MAFTDNKFMGGEKGNIFVILLGLIGFVAIVAALSFYFGQTIPLKKQMANTDSKKEVTAPSTSLGVVDKTSDWQLYINPVLGFEIKYPTDKKFTVSQNAQDEVFIMVPQSDYGLVIRKIGESRGFSPSDIAAEGIVNGFDKSGGPGTYPTLKDFQFVPTMVANAEGIEVVGPTPGSIFVSHSGAIWQFSGATLEKDLLKTMLSTFKFIDTKSARVGWKVFKFLEHPISLEYPDELKVKYFPTDNTGKMEKDRRSSYENAVFQKDGITVLGITADQPGMGFSGKEKFTEVALAVNGIPVIINGKQVIVTKSEGYDGYFSLIDYGPTSMLISCVREVTTCNEVISTIQISP